MTSTILGIIWVCVDCMLTHANGECDPEPDREPWNRIQAGQTVTMGLLREEHKDCDADDECDCETIEFSQYWCIGCGSTLHGTRHAFTLWEESSPAPTFPRLNNVMPSENDMQAFEAIPGNGANDIP